MTFTGRITLEAVCDKIVDCEHKTAPTVGRGYPSIRTPNIGRGRLILDGVNRVSEETYRIWTARERPREGDLILAREAPVGNVAIIPPGLAVCLGQRTVLIRANPSKVLPDFLVYLLLGHEVQGRVAAIANGATVGHLNVKDIRTLPLPELPSLGCQQRIAASLSAYDDLIENNTRRIAILEERGRLIYREWFVEFRFPGHKKVRTAEPGVGPARKGWQTKRVDAVYRTVLGGTPARGRDGFWTGGTVPWINSGKVNEIRILSPSELITPLALERSATKLMPPRTTVIAITGATLGQVSLLEAEMCANQSVVGVFDPEKRRNEYVYLMFKERIGALVKHASGGAQQHINKEIVNEMLAVDPPVHLLDQFRELVTPGFDLVANLLRKNENLRTTRDLLLPSLISGEIDISHLVKHPAAAIV